MSTETVAPAPMSSPPMSSPTPEPAFWISTVSLDDVEHDIAGGFVQDERPGDTRLRWLRRGDWIAMYSPRTTMRTGGAVQAFTAAGVVLDDEPVQVVVDDDHLPWRRQVEWRSTVAAAVRPLLPELRFVPDKQQWGYPFRRGLFRVAGDDFAVITTAMGLSRAPGRPAPSPD